MYIYTHTHILIYNVYTYSKIYLKANFKVSLTKIPNHVSLFSTNEIILLIMSFSRKKIQDLSVSENLKD